MAGVMKPSPGALRIIDDLEGGLAIVCNGNTAPKNISAGQYLFIKNHSTLPTGGYHATAAISSGGTISSSNVAADADGISNALNSKLKTASVSTGVTGATAHRSGNTVMLEINVTLTASSAGWVALDANLPSSLRPLANFYGTLIDDTTMKAVEALISSASGAISCYFDSARTSNIRGSITYCV